MFKDDISNRFIPKIGFSDDDLRNLEKVKDELKTILTTREYNLRKKKENLKEQEK